MGKIATELDRALAWREASGAAGQTSGRRLARGDGWWVDDVICTSGPADRSFVEQHSEVSIAIVVAGTFQYRAPLGRELMTPGSLLLGNAGECFECGHEHAAGDRCVAFRYSPDYFERLAADARVPRGDRRFRVPRLPPTKELAALVARASTGVSAATELSWEELAVQVAGAAIRTASGRQRDQVQASVSAVARVTDSVRSMERDPGARTTLHRLAARAGRSPFHYLRTFQQLTGVTPHQFILRLRLRDAATRLVSEASKVIDIALDAGFGDISNFNRSFRAEFGVTPRAYRRQKH